MRITPAPSQGAKNLAFRIKFLENEDLSDLENDVNIFLANEQQLTDSKPSGEEFISDIQYQVTGEEDDALYSVMILIGTWNPA